MTQILVTIDEKQSMQRILDAINMLRGVVSTSILQTPADKRQKQETYVKESLEKAMQEVRLAEMEGRELQSFDEFMAELDKEVS